MLKLKKKKRKKEIIAICYDKSAKEFITEVESIKLTVGYLEARVCRYSPDSIIISLKKYTSCDDLNYDTVIIAKSDYLIITNKKNNAKICSMQKDVLGDYYEITSEEKLNEHIMP